MRFVTAPIDKNTIQGDGFRFSGHTEYLQSKAGDGAKSLMILFDDRIQGSSCYHASSHRKGGGSRYQGTHRGGGEAL